MANEGMQLHRLSAQEQVFAKGDLVFLFKDCFTVHNFACNKTFRTYAEKGQVDIKPVVVRANVDLREYEAYDASPRKAKLQIAEIEWPTRLDPTAHLDMIAFIFHPQRLLENAVKNVADLTLMAKMLQTHAAHIKRLKIRMALGVRVPSSAQTEPQYEHIKMFLEAFAKCTALETLTIEQSDHVAKEAKLSSVQFRMFHILQNMKELKVLDFNGNVTLDAFGVDPEDNVRHNLSLVDFLPRSVCEFKMRDGPTPRTFKWADPLGFPRGMQRVMLNHKGWFPDLKKIAMPSSFWTLRPAYLAVFRQALNTNHITHFGFSDAFELNDVVSANMGGVIVMLPSPYMALDFVIEGLERDLVIDMRGADEAEREVRLEWAMNSPQADFLHVPNERSDGEEYTTVTIRKKNDCTLQVLI